MNRISLIISREYLTRIRKRSFLIMTLVTPLLFAAVIILPVYLSQSMKDESIKNVAIVDDTGLYRSVLKDQNNVHFIEIGEPVEQAKNSRDYYAILQIQGDLSKNPNAAYIYSEQQVSLDIKHMISNTLRKYIEQQKIEAYGDLDVKAILKNLETDVNITAIKWGKDGSEKRSSTELAMAVGMFSGFLIYMFIFLYGAQVLRGVIEEKTNRIIEVVISSVKPFQLMMGKIIGVAMVGLTQFILWVILTVSILFVVQTFVLPDDIKQQLIQSKTEQFSGANFDSPAMNVENQKLGKAIEAFTAINFTEVILFFVLFFLGGYMLYSALFAAIGAAVDQETDSQQFMLPITLPMIFAIYVGISAVNNPHGPIAFWCSLIPFTSPIVMMVRIPFEVPMWEKLVSLAILILTFILVTLFAAKIYRTGILMYGKKINYKELWKWIRY